MQSYILILLGVLVVLLIGVIYFGWRRIFNLEIENNKNKYDIEALRGLLNKMLSDGNSGEEINIAQQSMQFQEAEILKMMQQQHQQQQQQQYFQNKKKSVIEDETDDETLESSDEEDDEIPDNDEPQEDSK